MGISNDEGVALHIVPEPRVFVREDEGETSAGARPAIEPRKKLTPGSRGVSECGRQQRQARYRERLSQPERS